MTQKMGGGGSFGPTVKKPTPWSKSLNKGVGVHDTPSIHLTVYRPYMYIIVNIYM